MGILTGGRGANTAAAVISWPSIWPGKYEKNVTKSSKCVFQCLNNSYVNEQFQKLYQNVSGCLNELLNMCVQSLK